MDFSLFLALLLLLLALLDYGVGREGEDVQSSQEDHQGVRIEKSRDKHLLQRAGSWGSYLVQASIALLELLHCTLELRGFRTLGRETLCALYVL